MGKTERKKLKDFTVTRETKVAKQFLLYMKKGSDDGYVLLGVIDEKEAKTLAQDLELSLSKSIEEEKNENLILTAFLGALESEEEREKRLAKNILLVPVPSVDVITATPIFELN